jgi:prephenate dehydratase
VSLGPAGPEGRPTVAFQGEPGAYSEDAVWVAFPQAEPVPCERLGDAFAAVSEGRTAFGLVPVENSQAGSINETYELLLASDRLRILAEVVVPVDHALLGVPGARIEDVRTVSSHPQALAQCRAFLDRLGVEVVPALDTAGAARRVAEAGRPEHAAVAGERAGRMLGLTVLAARIQDEAWNATKFAVIGEPGRGPDPGFGRPEKTSVAFAVADRPGSLYRCLQPFAERGINLTKLESRPRPGAPFEYRFYVDVAAPLDDPGVAAALDEVREHTASLRVLGSYPIVPT